MLKILFGWLVSSGKVMIEISVMVRSCVSSLFGLCCRIIVCYGLVKLKCNFLSVMLMLSFMVSNSLNCVLVNSVIVKIVVSFVSVSVVWDVVWFGLGIVIVLVISCCFGFGLLGFVLGWVCDLLCCWFVISLLLNLGKVLYLVDWLVWIV